MNALLDMIDFPAVVLLGMAVAMGWVMWSAQNQANFDWGDAFKDEQGKVSWLRTAIPVSLVLSSWTLLYVVMNTIKSTFDAQGMSVALAGLYPWFVAYMLVWAGTKTADKALELAREWITGRAAPNVAKP
jgi:hypothetical protein